MGVNAGKRRSILAGVKFHLLQKGRDMVVNVFGGNMQADGYERR